MKKGHFKGTPTCKKKKVKKVKHFGQRALESGTEESEGVYYTVQSFKDG